MKVREWVESAPDELLEALQLVTVTNFVRQFRNDCFQLIGAHDGAMSEACKDRFRSHYKAISEFYDALLNTTRSGDRIGEINEEAE